MNIIKKILEKLFTNTNGIKILLEEAEPFETHKEYESACYSYACAIDQGEKDPQYKEKLFFFIQYVRAVQI